MEATIPTQDLTVNQDISFHKNISVSAIVMLAITLVLIFLAQYTSEISSSLHIFTLSAATILGIIGLVKLFNGKTKIIYNKTGCAVKSSEYYFESIDMGKLLRLVENKQFAEITKLKQISADRHGIKLDLMISDDKKYASAQLLQFIPFEYQPISGVNTFYEDDATALYEASAQLKKVTV